MRIVNVIVNLCGVGIIIYSLWLQKKWDEGVALIDTSPFIPDPWFIDICLVVGIVLCLSTLVGHSVGNCISNSTLCIYTVSCFSVILLQVVVVIAIFFNVDWEAKIAKYIDEDHDELKKFVIFHLRMCRLIIIMVVVAQISIVVLGVILWSIGVEPRRHNHSWDPPDFTQSFLVVNNSTPLHGIIETCRECEDLDVANPRQSFMSYIKGVFGI